MQYWCGKMVNGSTSRISTETKRIYSEDLEPPKPIPTYKWLHFLRIIMDLLPTTSHVCLKRSCVF